MKRAPEKGDKIITAFRDGQVTLRERRREEGFTNALQEIGYQRVLAGDLVIHAMDGFAGAIGVSDADGKSTPVYSVCTPTFDADAYYFALLLRHMALSGFVTALAKGVRERSTDFRWSDASVLGLPCPPLFEQRQIVSFLDRETAKIDALVEEQRQLIELLKEKRQAVISHAVTKGLDPTVPMKDSGVEWLGDVPEHWRVASLKREVSLLSGFAFPSVSFSTNPEDTPLLRGVNVAVGRTRWDDVVYWSREENDGLEGFELRAGDVVLGMDRPWIGDGLRVAQISEADLPCLLLQRVTALRPANGLLPDYLPHLLAGEAFHHHCVPEMTGVSVPHISPTQVGDFVVALPPLEEQRLILEHLARSAAIDEPLLAAAEDAITLLHERRGSLITAAVTGKIDVRSVAPRQAAAA